nr:MAG TPA: Glutathione-dependent formaldehyde-activating enzyme [Caudoviricetes sp.]
MICSCHCGALRFRGAFFYPLRMGGVFDAHDKTSKLYPWINQI